MNARDWALLELDARSLPGWKSRAVKWVGRERHLPEDPRDLALAERIVIGVIKNHTLLNHLAGHYAGRDAGQIEPVAIKILAIALYQLRFLDRVPASAAVDEAVEQCRRAGIGRAGGFVNAVLRNAARQPDPPLPDERADPEAHAAIVLSHPPELFRRLLKIMSVEDALRFCGHDNREPPTLVRLFRGVVPERLASDGVLVTPHEQPAIFVVAPAKRSLMEAWAAAGLAQVQDATSALVAAEMDLKPGQRVLDRCSGLGTKTLQIRELVGEAGSIVAVDPSAPRCESLRRLLEARGIGNVAVHQVSMLRQIENLSRASFDRALVDVPCSNSGVLARRPEARYAQGAGALRSLAALQRDTLEDTAPFVAPDGLLAYSTCSVWPEENERQVSQFLRRHPEFELQSSRSTLPAFRSEDPFRYHDGGFLAVLRRGRDYTRPAVLAD